MTGSFEALDWLVFGSYLAIIVGAGWYLSRRGASSGTDYFLGGNNMSLWVVAISVLATSQSAATFLGGPDQGFRGDLTYLSTNIGALLAALFVARHLIPRFYAMGATTVYELLEKRFDAGAMKGAGAMYFIGRIFASGARLYLAAIALSMLFFGDASADHIIIASLVLTVAGFGLTFIGGIRAIIWSDLLQCIVYIGAAIAVVGYLLWQIPADTADVLAVLGGETGGPDKLQLFDLSMDLSDPFTFWAGLIGFFLLNVAAFGMDQDMTQRLLTCRDSRDGKRAIYLATILIIPVMALFMGIGLLLHVFYEQPALMQAGGGDLDTSFSGETITVFMHYILTQLPAGLKGLVVVGVVAAALSTLNSGLNSMASVLVKDFYLPMLAPSRAADEAHVVKAGRAGMAIVGLLLFGMSVLCYYWQHHSDMPLLQFALGVMVFSYSGLLGVYFTALFTKRGTGRSVLAALAAGFLVTLVLQPWFPKPDGWPAALQDIAFPWLLTIGASVSFMVCMTGSEREQAE